MIRPVVAASPLATDGPVDALLPETGCPAPGVAECAGRLSAPPPTRHNEKAPARAEAFLVTPTGFEPVSLP